MKKLGYLVLVLGLVLSACQPENDLEQKKAEYEKAQKELADLKSKVHELKVELQEAGVIKESNNLSLVTAFELKPAVLEHKIDIRGTVKSRGNINISAETSGQVTSIKVKEGQKVKMGQTLVIQDAQILRNSMAELSTSLDLANTMYERQKKLWEKNIGTEIQYLEAKNSKESLERKLATTRSQLDKTIIKAPFSGVVDRIDVRVGENIGPGKPILRLVSLSDMYIKANVSESYVGKFEPNQEVDIYFPSTGMEMHSKISAIGQVIQPDNRTFELEVLIPSSVKVKPNMVAVLNISDYVNEEALAVPTNIVFTDNKGAFVYQLKKSDGSNVAIRADVTLGVTAGTATEIVSGLNASDFIIDKGIYDISNGSQVKVAE